MNGVAGTVVFEQSDAPYLAWVAVHPEAYSLIRHAIRMVNRQRFSAEIFCCSRACCTLDVSVKERPKFFN